MRKIDALILEHQRICLDEQLQDKRILLFVMSFLLAHVSFLAGAWFLVLFPGGSQLVACLIAAPGLIFASYGFIVGIFR